MGERAARRLWGPGARWLALAALILLVVVPVYLFSLRVPVTAMEEGALLLYPQQLLDGQWPNRDFEYVYGPGNLWVLAAAFEVGGASPAVERTVAVAYRLLLAAGVYGLVRPQGRRVALGVALTTWLLISPLMAAHSSVGAVGLAVAAVWCAAEVGRTGSPRRRRGFLLGAGFLAGLVVSYRFDFAVAVLPAQAVLLWPLGLRRDLRWLAGGGLAGLLPLAAHVAVVGPHEAATGMVLDPVLRHGSGRRLPLPPSFTDPPDSFTRIAHIFGETSWVPWSLPVQFSILFWSAVVALVLLWVVAWLRWRQERASAHVHVAVALLATGLFPYVVQRAEPGHVTLVLAVLAPLLLWAVGTRRPGSWDRRGAAVTGGSILVVAVLAAPAFLGDPILEQYRRLGRPVDVTEVAGGRGRTLPMHEDMADDIQSVVDYLQEHASAGDRLVIGPADLRKTNYGETYLYHLLPDLVPGTYHLEMNPGTANASWAELPDDLEDADWVVLSTRYDGWQERNASVKPGSGRAAAVVRDQLEPVAAIGRHYTIYRPAP